MQGPSYWQQDKIASQPGGSVRMTNNQKGKCENCDTTKIWHHQLYHAWMISPKQFPAGRFAFAISKILYKYKVICTHCLIASTSQILNAQLPT
jgi:hypothetical protein